jgi:hypothetical protein
MTDIDEALALAQAQRDLIHQIQNIYQISELVRVNTPPIIPTPHPTKET